MDRIQPQGVHMEFGNPVKGVFDEEPPYFSALRAVKVKRLPPGGAVAVRKIGPEIPEIVPFRS